MIHYDIYPKFVFYLFWDVDDDDDDHNDYYTTLIYVDENDDKNYDDNDNSFYTYQRLLKICRWKKFFLRY